jgi:hypothetical protein
LLDFCPRFATYGESAPADARFAGAFDSGRAMIDRDQDGNLDLSGKSVSELRQIYLNALRRRAPSTSASISDAIGEPKNEGPAVSLLLKCAEDLAENYEPSGAIFIVEENNEE